jgi:hypothetical protein
MLPATFTFVVSSHGVACIALGVGVQRPSELAAPVGYVCVNDLFSYNKFCVIRFRAYDQYNKTEPTYAQYCLFIYLFIFSPTCFGK